MATTKLFAIKTTEVKALAYIANPEKTDESSHTGAALILHRQAEILVQSVQAEQA